MAAPATQDAARCRILHSQDATPGGRAGRMEESAEIATHCGYAPWGESFGHFFNGTVVAN
jgi:hypothetical protein